MINHQKQINVDKILPHSKKRLIAGEDGHILVDGLKLESLTDARGFLTNIEDADEYASGDIVVCGTDGDFALYIYNQDKMNPSYTQKKLDFKVSNDCIYNIKAKEDKNGRSFSCWGELSTMHELIII